VLERRSLKTTHSRNDVSRIGHDSRDGGNTGNGHGERGGFLRPPSKFINLFGRVSVARTRRTHRRPPSRAHVSSADTTIITYETRTYIYTSSARFKLRAVPTSTRVRRVHTRHRLCCVMPPDCPTNTTRKW